MLLVGTLATQFPALVDPPYLTLGIYVCRSSHTVPRWYLRSYSVATVSTVPSVLVSPLFCLLAQYLPPITQYEASVRGVLYPSRTVKTSNLACASTRVLSCGPTLRGVPTLVRVQILDASS